MRIGNPFIIGVRVWAFNMNNIGHWEINTIIQRAEFLDLFGIIQFLAAKIIAGHTNNDKPLVLIFRPQALQPFILAGKATHRRGIDQQNHFATICCQWQITTINAGKTKIMGSSSSGRHDAPFQHK